MNFSCTLPGLNKEKNDVNQNSNLNPFLSTKSQKKNASTKIFAFYQYLGGKSENNEKLISVRKNVLL